MVIAPSALDLSVQAGKSENFTFVIGNDSSVTATYIVSLQSVYFGQSAETLSFTQPSTGIASWITLENPQFSLASGETREATLHADIPAFVPPQSATFAVLVTEQSQGDGNVSVATSVASLVFLSIDGESLAQVPSIQDFWTDGDEVRTTIGNEGQGILQPGVVLTVRNAFGRSVDEIELNADRHHLAPGASRDFAANITTALAFFPGLWREIADQRIGTFTAELSVTSDDGSNTKTAEESFLVWPWRSMLIIVTGGALFLVKRFALRSRAH